MPSILPGFEYDIFISYRHKDNKGESWVSSFVDALKTELDSTFKEEISVYFDTNPHDVLSDHHDVDLSLKEKIKALILIPIISQTYCDPASFAWKNEFLPFRDAGSCDSFGLKVKVANGNVTNRILPIQIHELDKGDVNLLEKELGGVLRAIDFTFKSGGVNRPLKGSDRKEDNVNKTSFGDQINKVANAIKEILDALKKGSPRQLLQNKEKLFSGSRTIPTPATTLFGRDKELNELFQLVKENRVVSIIGTGGIGKTRLALELASRLRENFSGNVAVVFLAALTTAEEVIPAIANQLGIKEAEGRNLAKTIASVIGDQKTLLALDNMEQVISVAPQIAELILNCTNLTILTTSRTPLKISAEFEYALRPLSIPADASAMSVEQVLEFPAISLFADRAKKVNGSFKLSSENAEDVVQICRRLDGLPLALELAAARTRMMSARQLLQRLEHALDILITGPKDLPQRHQTLRATIDWSHSLLNDTEKKLFRRMSVFSGGCTLEAIEQTCCEGASAFALNDLESLVDKALVQPIGSSGRFVVLETIKEYAAEKMHEEGETNEIRFLHADYFLKIASRIRNGLEDKDQIHAMQLGIEEELNMHSALEFLWTEGKGGNSKAVETGMMICGCLYFFWHIRCKHIMARHYSNSFLSLPNCPESGTAKCWCLNTVGLASYTLGKHEQSILEYQDAREIALVMGDRVAFAFALLGLFIAKVGLGRIDEAGRHQEELMPVSQEIGLDFYVGFAYWAEGLMHFIRGNLDAATAGYERALAIQRKIPDRQGSGISLSCLGLIASIRGNYNVAIELYQSSLTSFIEIGDRGEEARILEEMAWVFLKIPNVQEARSYFMKSIRAYEDVGSVRGIGLALMGIAGVESVGGNAARAIRIATAAQLFTEQEGIVNSYGEGFQGKVYLDNARNELSKKEFDKEVAEGTGLSLKETLQLDGS